MKESATLLLNDKSIQAPEAFDPIKAWIEYINRLFGVLSGFFAMIYFGMAVWFRGRISSGKGWGLGALFLLLLNGWLGSLVVATNLLPGVVTVHFVLSFLCLFAYMVSLHKAVPFQFEGLDLLKRKQWFGLWVSVFFIVIIGAWSREQVDALRYAGQLYVDGDTEGFWDGACSMFLPWTGCSPYIGICPFDIGLDDLVDAQIVKRPGGQKLPISHPYMTIALLCASQISVGVIHIWFVVPAWAQVVHVVVGSALITYIFAVYLSARSNQPS